MVIESNNVWEIIQFTCKSVKAIIWADFNISLGFIFKKVYTLFTFNYKKYLPEGKGTFHVLR